MLVHTHQRPQSFGWNTTLDITFHLEISLQVCQTCLRLKTFAASWLQLFMPAHSRKHWRQSKIVFENLGGQFLWLLCKISSVRCLTDWMQSLETKETLFCASSKPTHCLEVTMSLRYCAIFGCCNITDYYNGSWAAICIIFSSNNFVDHTYRIKFACLWNLQHTSFHFQNRSLWCLSPYW